MKFGDYEIRILPEKIIPEIKRPELALVVIMLISLVLIIIIVLLVPLGPEVKVSNLNESGMIDLTDSVLKARTDLLTIIITAFGAWVGAGAAYFFGRENLKQATEGMLGIIESPAIKLQSTKIEAIYPFKIDKIFKEKDLVNDVYQWLKITPKAWFIPILDINGRLKTVIHEEAVYRYKLKDEVPKFTGNETLADVLAFIATDPEIDKETRAFWVTVRMDDSLGMAENVMTHGNARLAIIVDGKGVRPTLLQPGISGNSC